MMMTRTLAALPVVTEYVLLVLPTWRPPDVSLPATKRPSEPVAPEAPKKAETGERETDPVRTSGRGLDNSGVTAPRLNPKDDAARKLKADKPTIDVSTIVVGKALEEGAMVIEG